MHTSEEAVVDRGFVDCIIYMQIHTYLQHCKHFILLEILFIFAIDDVKIESI